MIYLATSSGCALRTIAEQRSMARHLLGLALASEFNLGSNGLAIEKTKSGKPVLMDFPDIHFSCSHCQGAAVISVASIPIGIDIENIRSFSPFAAAKALSVDEQRIVQASDQPDSTFFKLWTLKESYVKALGTGICIPLKKVTFPLIPDSTTSCRLGRCQFHLIGEIPGFVIAICMLNQHSQPDLEKAFHIAVHLELA